MFKRKKPNNICEDEGTHHFSPRYYEVPYHGPIKIKNAPEEIIDIRDIMYYKVYVHDICTRCGKVIKK